MEDNAGQIKILFLFHFTGVKEFHNNVFENLVSQDYYLLTRMNKMLVYNSKTGEIYKNSNFRCLPQKGKSKHYTLQLLAMRKNLTFKVRLFPHYSICL